jgi:hypothetical protein
MVSKEVWKSERRFCDNSRSKFKPIKGYIWGDGGSTDLVSKTQVNKGHESHG